MTKPIYTYLKQSDTRYRQKEKLNESRVQKLTFDVKRAVWHLKVLHLPHLGKYPEKQQRCHWKVKKKNNIMPNQHARNVTTSRNIAHIPTRRVKKQSTYTYTSLSLSLSPANSECIS